MNATQVPQDPTISLLTLIGTWALVVVAVITVMVTAWQTRKGQKILYEQVKESIAQTDLQRQQISRLVDEQERPRIRELVKKVLTPLIGQLEWNNQVRMRSYLEQEVILHDRTLEGGTGSAASLTFDSFRSSYPELEVRIKAYDEQSIDLRNMRVKLERFLVSRVKEVVPTLLKESTIPAEWNIGKQGSPSVDVDQLVTYGILATLEEKSVMALSGVQGFLWSEKKKEFMALTEETAAKQLIDEMKKLAQKCYDDGLALKLELEKLRENLGSRYKITREDYFVGNPLDK